MLPTFDAFLSITLQSWQHWWKQEEDNKGDIKLATRLYYFRFIDQRTTGNVTSWRRTYGHKRLTETENDAQLAVRKRQQDANEVRPICVLSRLPFDHLPISSYLPSTLHTSSSSFSLSTSPFELAPDFLKSWVFVFRDFNFALSSINTTPKKRTT